MKLQDILDEWNFSTEEWVKLWNWLDEKEIYGIYFDGIEFEPRYDSREIYVDTASSLDVDKIYLKTFGYKSQNPQKNYEGKIEKTWFQEFTLREVFVELELEFE